MTTEKSNIPSRDALFNDRTETMTAEEQYKYMLMQSINHFVNMALYGHTVRSTGKAERLYYSVFLAELVRAFIDTVAQREDCSLGGKDIAVYDEFMRIAEFAYSAKKYIVKNPSRQRKKIEVKLPATRAAGFTSKTMQWLSSRPGRNVAEKISPENKILTTRTIFSADTQENREIMYLYKNLHTIVNSRLSKTRCYDCGRVDECHRDWVRDMKKLLVTYSHVKMDDLGQVRAEKQAKQNNKLMCDMNYKIIWDAVKMLTKVEENIVSEFENIAQRLAQLVYWLAVGFCLADKRAKIVDRFGYVEDDGGKLSFKSMTDDEPAVEDRVVFADEENNYLFSCKFLLSGSSVHMMRCDDWGEEGVSIFEAGQYIALVCANESNATGGNDVGQR